MKIIIHGVAAKFILCKYSNGWNAENPKS